MNSYVKNNVYSTRKQIIKIIKDFMKNDTFDYYYKRWFCSDKSSFTETEIEKLHNPYGWMSKVIRELCLLAPIIGKDGFTTTNKKKKDVLYKSLDQAKFVALNEEIDETCEMAGDFFAYWYYEQSETFHEGWIEIVTSEGITWENPIPRIKVLESDNMKYITYDSNYNITGYVYEETRVKQDINESTGQVMLNTYDVQYIFKEGYIRVNDPYTYGKDGYKIFINKPFETDIIRMIHVPSYKKQRDMFSRIPAVDYLDPIVLLDDKTTNLAMINKYHGFPVTWTTDLDIDWDNSSVMPGGVVRTYTQYSKLNENITELKHKGEVKNLEITNKLETLIYEINEAKKSLYKVAGLIREEMEEQLSKSDSSRIITQLRIQLENKFEKRSLKKAEAFKNYFKSVLINTGNYNETDKKNNLEITFKMPDVFLNTSVFDELVLKKSKMLLGLTSIDEEMDNERMTEEDKTKRRKNIQEEVVGGADDVTITKEEKNVVQNGQASEVKVDNQLKQQ